MSARLKQQRHGGNRGEVQKSQALQTSRALCGQRNTAISGNQTKLPPDWRERLPAPETYYRGRVAALGSPNSSGWAQGRCPFHDDRQESFSVNLAGERGLWRCFAGCGNGDLIGFHQRLTGNGFKAAVADLLEIRA